MIYSEKWRAYSKTAVCPYWLSAQGYKKTVEDIGFKTVVFDISSGRAAYNDLEHFKDYIRGWLPCMLPLPKSLEEEFLNDVAAFTKRDYGANDLEIPYKQITLYLEK